MGLGKIELVRIHCNRKFWEKNVTKQKKNPDKSENQKLFGRLSLGYDLVVSQSISNKKLRQGVKIGEMGILSIWHKDERRLFGERRCR